VAKNGQERGEAETTSSPRRRKEKRRLRTTGGSKDAKGGGTFSTTGKKGVDYQDLAESRSKREQNKMHNGHGLYRGKQTLMASGRRGD